jgi:hypothetical protein
MPPISKSDTQTDAHTYIVNVINTQSNAVADPPYGSDQGLSYCNNAMLEFFWYDPPEAALASFLNGNVTRAGLLARVRILGGWYARTTWAQRGLTGTTSSGVYDGMVVPFTETRIFFVKPEYHQDHYDATLGILNSDGAADLAGNIERNDIIGYLTRIKNIIINNYTTGPVVDLKVCHSSCHSNCHGSRGRR